MAIAVIPAAGRSRRMGRSKLLLPYEGDTVLGRLVTALQEGGIGRIVVVSRRDDRRLRRWAKRRGLEVTTNPAPERGMLSSVWRGLEALGGAERLAAGGEPLLVSPGDLPTLRATTVRALLAALEQGQADLAVPVFQGRRGHPLGIAPRLLPEVERLDLEVGLRQLLERHAEGLVEVEVVDPGAVADLDSPADYARLTGES